MSRAEGRLDEAGLIARFFRPLAAAPGAALLSDDAATIPTGDGPDLVVTTDALVAGVHFFPDDPADAVARKALRVNLSDLAAKGARPAGYLVTLALPEDWETDWLDGFAEGLAADQEEFVVSLLGGDTVRTPGPLMISVTALGFAQEGRTPRRGGGAPGQRLYVTGTIGDAALGLRLRQDERLALKWDLRRDEREHLLDRYLIPEPRLALAGVVAAYAAASMDLSDGLVGDLEKLAEASRCGAILEADRVPLSRAAARAIRADPSSLTDALTGGDDYELLLAIHPDDVDAFEQEARAAGVPVVDVGALVEGAGVEVESNGRPLALETRSFSHF
ncbi:thiamine-phosphate kinase [Chelatococcus sambhunathii]|uniref:Thiamine-monophosphate kinase n=1 Tax=Chelatococcus sambhunathii TaxID=363953 RepID=A0ABU1DER7_9HYPH|nr:thiamine-phosphate kinase [Chelatococcus sambhunathii]MDR4306410.1 thiamine-phosphate kinase [Chelatococcus sambhunathii]